MKRERVEFPFVILVNGEPKTLHTIGDFTHLVEDEMGHDAANCLFNLFEDLLETIDCLEEELRDG